MRPIYTVLLCLISLSLTAQDKIEGIGKFKIGKTTINIVEEIAIQQRTEIKEVNSKKKQKGITHGIYEVKVNTEDPASSPYEYRPCPSARVFIIKKYSIADIPLKNIELTFLNDVLVRLHADGSSEIEDALTTKYGKPNLKNDSKPATDCPGYTDNTYTKKWGEGDITAQSYLSTSRTYGCREFIFYSFSVSSDKALTVLSDCDEKTEQVITNSKKEKLKDF